MDEEQNFFEPEPVRTFSEPISVCNCLRDDDSSQTTEISHRKLHILSTVARTESYLRERRIPELIRFLLTKVIAQGSNKPIEFLEKLLNDCMLYRAGHGFAPVLYENKHLEAVVKSFDPGQRGWLSEGQMRRAYITLGLSPAKTIEDRVLTNVALYNLQKAQETELFNLIAAGMNVDESSSESNSSTTV
ncbi:EF hand 2 domain containing protein [Operophtera brumata]|uniref:EF hand 2 domain containing protein n=1 Tax=Operophtera brumata TaxID=104452 RepID=A0A0L7K2M6_OPEBR|nr:EF hand 2 domain containing protein [Operophtera brumata]